MSWNKYGEIDFKVGIKENTQIKYINNSSDHNKMVLKEIPKGVFERLTKLTTMNDERRLIKIEELYLIYEEELKKSKLIDDTPAFGEVERNMSRLARIDAKRDREKEWKD